MHNRKIGYKIGIFVHFDEIFGFDHFINHYSRNSPHFATPKESEITFFVLNNMKIEVLFFSISLSENMRKPRQAIVSSVTISLWYDMKL